MQARRFDKALFHLAVLLTESVRLSKTKLVAMKVYQLLFAQSRSVQA
jgi:hypothetical protein